MTDHPPTPTCLPSYWMPPYTCSRYKFWIESAPFNDAGTVYDAVKQIECRKFHPVRVSI